MQSQSFMKSQVLWGHFCLSRELQPQVKGRSVWAFRDPVVAADRASTDWNLAEQGDISELSRHQHKVTTPNDSAWCGDLTTEHDLAAQPQPWNMGVILNWPQISPISVIKWVKPGKRQKKICKKSKAEAAQSPQLRAARVGCHNPHRCPTACLWLGLVFKTNHSQVFSKPETTPLQIPKQHEKCTSCLSVAWYKYFGWTVTGD